MKRIGPSFYDELVAAGVTGLNMSWGENGKILFGDDMTQKQKDAVVEVYDNHDPGPEAFDKFKKIKIKEFMTEGVKRIAAQVPDWDSLETIKTVSGLWNSHLATNATPAQLKAKDIYLYVRDTAPAKVNAAIDQTALEAIDSAADDPFGDGTLWPV